MSHLLHKQWPHATGSNKYVTKIQCWEFKLSIAG